MVAIGAMAGYVLARKRSKWGPVVNFFVLAGLIVPPAVVPTIWVLQGLKLFGTMPGMILIEATFGLSFCILLFRAFVGSIPRELDEAAVLDGAGPIRLFFRVVLPLLRPVIVTVIVVQAVFVFNDFAGPLYFLPNGDQVTVQLALYTFQGQNLSFVQPAVHGHLHHHHPAAHRLHLLQPADRRRHHQRRGQGLTRIRQNIRNGRPRSPLPPTEYDRNTLETHQ